MSCSLYSLEAESEIQEKLKNMKIITELKDDNDNVLARIETLSMEAHEEEMRKIQHKFDEAIENEVNNALAE